MRIAAKVLMEKEMYPLRFCANRKCLWRLSHGDCPKHGETVGGFHALKSLHDSRMCEPELPKSTTNEFEKL